MTRFLIHANGPHVSTGYGVQCALLAERLKNDGHDVAVSCTYGQQGATGSWRGVTLYPCGYEVNGNDVIHSHAHHHFQGDELGGWIIPILDVWVLKNPLLSDFNVAAWCPVDHFPVPPEVVKFFHRTGAVPIAMSQFGERELRRVGLDPVYIPLAVDTKVMKPTPTVETSRGPVTARELLDIPNEAFVVGMVAMNKGAFRDRKGFNEALRAFARFHQRHPEAILYMHTEKFGAAEGINLVELATHAGIPPHAMRWVDQYAYRMGLPPQMMAAAYTAMDVLLAPSHGEGFCVPLVEAQACGTPVIATDFSAQAELVGIGWKVEGQPEWDPAQSASYIVPSIVDIVDKLEQAYQADLVGMQEQTVGWALHYDADTVFDNYWRPFLASLDNNPEPLALDRKPIPETDGVAVVVPAMRRPQNVAPLLESLHRCELGATAYFVCDPDDTEEIEAVTAASGNVILSQRGHTYAAKANVALDCTEEPWIFLCGDDVRFRPGWLDEARKLSDRYDVIGTNDSFPGTVRNPDVASGAHSDHCFFRRSYVDTYGASLDGPGSLASEEYEHWFVDREQVELAKARGVFAPCLSAVVEHLHPGYENKPRDDTYMRAIDSAARDEKRWNDRRPLVEMQRTSRGKVR